MAGLSRRGSMEMEALGDAGNEDDACGACDTCVTAFNIPTVLLFWLKEKPSGGKGGICQQLAGQERG